LTKNKFAPSQNKEKKKKKKKIRSYISKSRYLPWKTEKKANQNDALPTPQQRQKVAVFFTP